jgi:hypothetical protein
MIPPQTILNELIYMSKFIANVLGIGILLGEGDALPVRVIDDSR